METRNHGLDEREMELVKLLMADCKSTGDIQAKLKKLFAGTIEQMLEAEMDEHLGYEKNSVDGNNSGNSRNGYGKKTISSDYGDCEISVPRDRNGEFEPKVIEKRQTRTDEIEQKIMSMYAKGMSQRDIEDTLREIYGSDISQGLISRITDKILPEVNEWQNRLVICEGDLDYDTVMKFATRAVYLRNCGTKFNWFDRPDHTNLDEIRNNPNLTEEHKAEIIENAKNIVTNREDVIPMWVDRLCVPHIDWDDSTAVCQTVNEVAALFDLK